LVEQIFHFVKFENHRFGPPLRQQLDVITLAGLINFEEQKLAVRRSQNNAKLVHQHLNELTPREGFLIEYNLLGWVIKGKSSVSGAGCRIITIFIETQTGDVRFQFLGTHNRIWFFKTITIGHNFQLKIVAKAFSSKGSDQAWFHRVKPTPVTI
jgi:hypothetical protein